MATSNVVGTCWIINFNSRGNFPFSNATRKKKSGKELHFLLGGPDLLYGVTSEIWIHLKVIMRYCDTFSEDRLFPPLAQYEAFRVSKLLSRDSKKTKMQLCGNACPICFSYKHHQRGLIAWLKKFSILAQNLLPCPSVLPGIPQCKASAFEWLSQQMFIILSFRRDSEPSVPLQCGQWMLPFTSLVGKNTICLCWLFTHCLPIEMAALPFQKEDRSNGCDVHLVIIEFLPSLLRVPQALCASLGNAEAFPALPPYLINSQPKQLHKFRLKVPWKII